MVKRIGFLALLLTSLVFLTSCTNIQGLVGDKSLVQWLLAIVIIALAWWYTFKRK